MIRISNEKVVVVAQLSVVASERFEIWSRLERTYRAATSTSANTIGIAARSMSEKTPLARYSYRRLWQKGSQIRDIR